MAWALERRYLPTNPVLPGLTIDGRPVGEGPSAASELANEQARRLVERRIALVFSGHEKPVLETTLEALGARVDVARTVDVARRVGKAGDLITRAEAARDARAGKIDVPLYPRIDRDVAMAKLLALKELLDTQPVSARLDLDKHATVAGRDGIYIDADESIAAIERALLGRRSDVTNAIEAIELSVKAFAPQVSSAFLASLDITTVIAEYETYFSRTGDQQKRGKNIDNAARKLDGVVISPGELVSFNEVVGERSEANGFEKSWEIFKGEMVEGVGGGTCQVASTFHAAAFFAGFDVLERLPHSRPSAYIPMGLDSTVVFPAVDLKVRNPHPFPIVVHATAAGGKLRIELLGKVRPTRVGFGREVLSTLPYKRKVEEDDTLSGKKVLVKQHGIKGYKIKVSRLFTYPNGTTKKEELTDTYPPTTEIYKVPLGFDVALLPPLPEREGEDTDSTDPPEGAPSSVRASPSSTEKAANVVMAKTSDVEFVDAPGAHAPTAQQREPEKTIWLKR